MNLQPAIARDRLAPDPAFLRDVIVGLTARPKRLPPKYFYDEAGSRLFEEITQTPEYYPTRSEIAILRERAPDMARLLPAQTALIELGSGSSKKACCRRKDLPSGVPRQRRARRSLHRWPFRRLAIPSPVGEG